MNVRHTESPHRIHFLDEMRGFAILLMIAFHAFYTAGYVFGMEWGKTLFVFFMPAEPFFAGVFIFICGISCRLSRSNLKRGMLLLAVALCVSLVLWLFLPKQLIVFGILHFLSVAILIFWLLRPALDRIPPLAGIVLCALLFLLTWWSPTHKGGMVGIKGWLWWNIPETITRQAWLLPLGFGQVKSADYFPLFPWLFCFLGGCFFGIWAKRGQLPLWMSRSHAPALSGMGRRSLLIYILHQPIVFAVFWLIQRLI